MSLLRPPASRNRLFAFARSLFGRCPPAFGHLPHTPPQSPQAEQFMKPSFLSDLAFSVGLSFKKPTCFYLSSLRKPFICKDFRSCFRDPNFGKQLLQHRPICPIAPVLLGHFRATPNSFFDHLVNNDDILVLFGGFLCCGRGTLQTFEKSTQTAHRPLENEQTHTL